MLSSMKVGTIVIGIAAICSCAVWAGVLVRTGEDGSVTVVTDRVRVTTNEGGSNVTINDGNTYSSQTFSSSHSSSTNSNSSSYSNSSTFSSNSSITQSSSTIPYSRLSTSDYLLLVSGSGDGDVTIEGKTVANLNDISTLRLNTYLRRGDNAISISGNGATNLRLALVETELGKNPYFNNNGQVVGAKQIMIQHQQSSSGGDWTSAIEILVE